MTAPDVIERQLIDINLKGGVNEHERPEVLAWNGALTRSENTAYDEYGVIHKRPGLVVYSQGTDEYPVAGQLQSMMRAIRLPGGLGVIRRDGFNQSELLDLNESLALFTRKGFLPKYAVDRQTVSSWTAPRGSELCCIVVTDQYKVLVTNSIVSRGSAARVFNIVVVDLKSENIVRLWTYNPSPDIDVLRCVDIGNGELHFYGSLRLGGQGVFFRIGLGSLPANGAIAPTTTNLVGTQPVVDCIRYQGGSAVLHQDGRVQRFNGSGTSVVGGAVGSFVEATGIDSDGVLLFVVGYDATDFVRIAANGTTLATTDTSKMAHGGQTGPIRVAYDPFSGQMSFIIWRSATSISTVKYPRCQVVLSNIIGAPAFSINKTLCGWVEASLPFYADGNLFVALANQMAANSGVNPLRSTVANSVCIVGLTNVDIGTEFSGVPDAVIDTYIASLDCNDQESGAYEFSVQRAYPHRPVVMEITTEVYVATMNAISTGSTSFDFIRLEPGRAPVMSGSDDIISCGFGCYYDSYKPVELGFVNAPSLFAVADAGGTGVDVGLHTYMAVYEYKCMDGNSRFSRTSLPTSVSLVAPKNVNVEFLLPSVSRSPLKGPLDKTVAHVYRTTAGGRVMYLVDSFQIHAPGDTLALQDDMSDATLITRPQLFRQPLVAGSPLDRYHTLATSCVTRHKDRVFYAEGPNVYYSSFAVEGEAPWFNPVFKIYVPSGTGPITALASVDGVLAVFKEDAIFLIDGDGPPENGGSGTEYTPPRRIQTEFGCVDQRSVLALPDGIMFRSHRGFEMLGSNSRVKFIGEPVTKTTDANRYTGGALFDRNLGRALFVVADTYDFSGDKPNFHQYLDATILAYDLTSGAWSTWKPSGGINVQDLVYADVQDVNPIQPVVLYFNSTSSVVYCEFDGICMDGARPFADVAGSFGGTYVSQVLETAWIKLAMQDRHIIDEVLLLARNLNNADLKVSVAYDYSDTYEVLDATVFEADNWVGEELKQLSYQVPRPHVSSIRFKFEDLPPSDTGSFPVFRGQGPEILGLTVKLGRIGEGVDLPAKHKG